MRDDDGIDRDLRLTRWVRDIGGAVWLECAAGRPVVTALDVPGVGVVRHERHIVAYQIAYSRWRRARQAAADADADADAAG